MGFVESLGWMLRSAKTYLQDKSSGSGRERCVRRRGKDPAAYDMMNDAFAPPSLFKETQQGHIIEGSPSSLGAPTNQG